MKSEVGLLEKPYREAYEINAALAWGTVAVGIIIFQYTTIPPEQRWSGLALSVVFASLVLGAYRFMQALKVWFKRVKLFGGNITVMEPDDYLKLALSKPGYLYLGQGFEWTNDHAQLASDMQKANLEHYRPPKLSFAIHNILYGTNINYKENPEERFKGKTWIHGLGLKERPLFWRLDDTAGNNVIPGTTGAGKTRLYETLVTQLIHQNPKDCVIIFDPKGDFELFQRVFRECQRAGREDDFVYFSSAHTKYSCKVDPLKNWAEVSEIASRIESILPSDGGGGDSFTKFAWDVINAIAGAFVFMGIRPSLVMLTDIVDTSPDELVKDCIMKHLEECEVENYRKRYLDYIQKISENPNEYDKPDKLTPIETVAAVHFYQNEIKHEYNEQAIDNIISYYHHNRAHAGKMLAILKPILKTLTSGGIRQLLSPETADENDYRPTFDTRKMISEKKVCYIGINSMGDQTVANSIGSILLSDFVSSMAARYNHKVTGDHKVHIIVDESSELVNLPFQALLNKGRGAGARVYFATQTTPDFVVKLGTEELKDQTVGNANNVISLRVIDDSTKEFVSNRAGPATIRTVQTSQSMASNSDMSQYNGGYGDRSTDNAEGEMFPVGLMDDIPDLEFLGIISAGRIVKGRIPIIKQEENMPTYMDLPWVKREIQINGAL